MTNVKCVTTTICDFSGIKAVVFQTLLHLNFNTCLQNAFFTFKMQCFVLRVKFTFSRYFYALVKI